MQEIKERLMNVLYGLQGHLDVFPPIIRQEFYCLQLRMCCESLALACLVAHGDMNTPKKMKKIWNADELMKALARLNTTFFPEPIHIENQKNNVKHLSANDERDYLNKKDFIKLYHSLGQKLHRGTIENMHLNMRIINFNEVDSHVKKFCWLLETHKISMPEAQMHIICLWGGKDEKPHVAIAIPFQN